MLEKTLKLYWNFGELYASTALVMRDLSKFVVITGRFYMGCRETIDNQYRKIVWAKDPQKGTTGIYLRDLNGFNNSTNSYLALSMETSKLTSKQQETVLKIFKTVRHKNQKLK